MFDQSHQAALLLKSLNQMINQTQSCNASIQKLLSIADNNQDNQAVGEIFDTIRIRMLLFIHKLFGSPDFLRSTIVQGLQSSPEDVQQYLQALLESIIVTLDKVEGRTRKLGHCYEKVFEAVLAVVPMTFFSPILAQLISLNQPSTIQRKALEVLNARLNQEQQINNDLAEILEALTTLIESPKVSPVNQQIALICLKTLAKNCPSVDDNKMMEVCARISAQSVLESFQEEPVMGAGILCLTHLLECLGMQAVVHLKSVVPWLLSLMDRVQVMKSMIVLNSLVVSMQRLMDKFAGFLNPYYPDIVVAAAQLSAWHRQRQSSVSDMEYRQCGSRLKQLHSALSCGIPFHALLKLAPLAYKQIRTNPVAIIALANIMAENVNNVNKSEILSSSSLSMDFFMEAFKYRQRSPDLVNEVEEALVGTFLAFGLKLSLDDFKPLFYKLFNLALDDMGGVSTVFHISSLVAQKLKSLFNFVCEMIVQKATGILQQSSKDHQTDPKKMTMLTFIFEALAAIFKYNRVDILMKSYEEHVNALLEHLDEGIHEDTLNRLRECLGELAATTEDETQWKYLNYQVLMLIRSQNSKVRRSQNYHIFFITNRFFFLTDSPCCS